MAQENTARIEFGTTAAETRIFVDGQDITQNIPATAIKVNARTKANEFTTVTLELVGAQMDCDIQIETLVQALRDEADRIETLIT